MSVRKALKTLRSIESMPIEGNLRDPEPKKLINVSTLQLSQSLSSADLRLTSYIVYKPTTRIAVPIDSAMKAQKEIQHFQRLYL